MTAIDLMPTTRAPGEWSPPAAHAPAVLPRRWSPRLAVVVQALPSLVWIAIVFGGLLVFRTWWETTPHIASTTADVLTNVGRLLGLTAGYLCAVLLILMARVPVLENVVGTNRLVQWHSRIGRYTVNALIGHVGFIVVGYSALLHHNVVRQGLDLEEQYPDVLMASAGFALFLLVGVTSARAARKRLRYETWYLLHLYTYLAIGLAFAHQFATGAQFVANPSARRYWTALYVTAAALVLWYRLLVPLRSTWRHRLRVTDVVRETADVVSVHLAGLDVGGLRAQPGQYVRLRFLTSSGWWQSHPYSLSAAPRHGSLRVTLKDLGDHSGEICRSLRPGVKVLVEGPYGALTEQRRSRQRVLLIGGGIGITPLRALFESLDGDPGDVTLLYRASTPEHVVFRDELDEIASRRGFEVRYLTGPRAAGDWVVPADSVALDAVSIRRLVPDVIDRDCFLCGPGGLETAAIEALRTCGVPAHRIHTEQFDF
jgi:predicted ferric reductase